MPPCKTSYVCKVVYRPYPSLSFNDPEERFFPAPAVPSFWEFKLELEPDNGHDDPAIPGISFDLLATSPRCLFSISNFSRFRQFLRCLRLRPDLETPGDGDGAASPTTWLYL